MFFKALFMLIMCCWFLSSACLLSAETSHVSPHHSTAQLRAAYWGIKPLQQAEQQLHLLQTYGLNTALVKDGGYQIREQLWKGWGDIAGKQNISFFPVLNFAGEREIEALQGQYTPYVNRDGMVLQSTPCPMDANYWNASIGKRFERLAHLSKLTSIAGLTFDTEMYGSDISIYHDFCFCNTCWTKFFEAEKQKIPNLSPKERFEYLVQHQLVEQYAMFQEKQLQALLALIEKRIHIINPHLSLGILAYKNTWFYRGLIGGLGTSASPVMIFSESTYVRGFTPYVMEENAFITGVQPGIAFENLGEDIPPIAQYIPGLWLGRFFPEDLPSQLYNLATHTNGYWLFTTDSLWTDEQLPEPYALHGSNDKYWKALKNANDELEKFSQSPDSYQSTLSPVYQSSFYDRSQGRLITQPSLKSFIRTIALGSIAKNQQPNIRSSIPITYRGKVLLHCFRGAEQTLPQTNEPSKIEKEKVPSSEKIRIKHIPIGEYKDETHYKFFNSDGLLFLKGSLNKQNRSVEITLPPNISGLVSLLIDSGANASQIFFSELPFMIEASVTFPLSTNNTAQSYMFYVKPEQQQITLRAYCSTNETASFSFQSPENILLQKYNVIDFTDIRIPISHARNNSSLDKALAQTPDSLKMEGTFWEIAVNPVPSATFDDVQFYFYNHEFPYLIVEND